MRIPDKIDQMTRQVAVLAIYAERPQNYSPSTVVCFDSNSMNDRCSKPKFFWDVRNRILRFKTKFDPDLSVRATEANVHAIFLVVVKDLALKLFFPVDIIITEPFPSKIFEGTQFWPKTLVQVRPSFAAMQIFLHVPRVALVVFQHR